MHLLPGSKIEASKLPFLHIKDKVFVYAKRWPFSFNFKYHHSIIVSGCKKIQCWMGRKNPKSVILIFKILQTSPSLHVPNAYAFIFGIAYNKVRFWMEQNAGNVVIMSSTRINLPRL